MWPIIKKAVNSDLSTPLNVLIDSVKTIVNSSKTVIDTVNTNVGSNANAASATGSLHAKVRKLQDDLTILKNDVADGVYLNAATPSDTIKISSDRSSNNDTNLAMVTSAMIGISGRVRVKFTGSANQYGGNVQIYRNGLPYGTARSVISTSAEFIENLYFAEGDTIEIWGKGGSTLGKIYISNFRICFDFTSSYLGGINYSK